MNKNKIISSKSQHNKILKEKRLKKLEQQMKNNMKKRKLNKK